MRPKPSFNLLSKTFGSASATTSLAPIQRPLAEVVGNLLRAQEQTLSVAESCTGGGLGSKLTDISGSSDYFIGGIIAYQNRIKEELLQVSSTDLEAHGAVSAPVAQQMAEGVRKQLKTDWGIGITGVAGPTGGTEQKPVGLVHIAIAGPTGQCVSYEYRRTAQQDRAVIRDRSISFALDMLRRQLLTST